MTTSLSFLSGDIFITRSCYAFILFSMLLAWNWNMWTWHISGTRSRFPCHPHMIYLRLILQSFPHFLTQYSPCFLICSTACNLCFVSECWRSPRPGVITLWLTDWQALLSWPSQLQVNPNSWTVMDGSWQRTDSDCRERTSWLECYSPIASG